METTLRGIDEFIYHYRYHLIMGLLFGLVFVSAMIEAFLKVKSSWASRKSVTRRRELGPAQEAPYEKTALVMMEDPTMEARREALTGLVEGPAHRVRGTGR